MASRALVFGTFDEFHAGHLFFLRTAKSFADELIVVIARDEHVRKLKHHEPTMSESDRLDLVQRLSFVDQVVLSDDTLGSFEVMEHWKPDVVIVGYDQNELADALNEWGAKKNVHIRIKRLEEGTIISYASNMDRN